MTVIKSKPKKISKEAIERARLVKEWMNHPAYEIYRKFKTGRLLRARGSLESNISLPDGQNTDYFLGYNRGRIEELKVDLAFFQYYKDILEGKKNAIRHKKKRK